MDVEDFKKLESRATPRPWKGRELVCHGQGQATGPAHEIPEDIRTASVLPWTADCLLIARMRNLAPELLDLWDACNEMDGIGAEHPMRSFRAECVKTALNALNEKAATMAV